MQHDKMTDGQRLLWYTAFFDEASKIGSIDRGVLSRRMGIVEMLRVKLNADPEEAAVGYMAVQTREHQRGSTAESDKADFEARYGVTDEEQQAIKAWFESYIACLGPGVFQELREIVTVSIQACVEHEALVALNTIAKNAERVNEICELGMVAGRVDITKTAAEVGQYLDELAKKGIDYRKLFPGI